MAIYSELHKYWSLILRGGTHLFDIYTGFCTSFQEFDPIVYRQLKNKHTNKNRLMIKPLVSAQVKCYKIHCALIPMHPLTPEDQTWVDQPIRNLTGMNEPIKLLHVNYCRSLRASGLGLLGALIVTDIHSWSAHEVHTVTWQCLWGQCVLCPSM